jgi:hypothetical protein
MSAVLSKCSSLFTSLAVVLFLLAALAAPQAMADVPAPVSGPPAVVDDTCPDYNQGSGDPIGCLATGYCDAGSCKLIVATRTCYCP